MAALELPLAGRTIALPESRQLDVLAGLLERRGATTVRCPLVAILDAPNPEPILDWLRLFIDSPCDDFIILTGEGLRRLLGFAERAGLLDGFILALAQTRTIVRGPKPARALKELGLQADIQVKLATTEGVITSLERLALTGRRVAVQLYGSDPNLKLIDYLRSRWIEPLTVAPYIYADQANDGKVIALIEQLAAGGIDAIAFTSQAQWRRLLKVAERHNLLPELRSGLEQTQIAAVGPVVAAALEEAGYTVAAMPDSSYFMKPLTTALMRLLSPNSSHSTDG